MKQKQVTEVTLQVDEFYKRLGWLVWQGHVDQANALRDFAAWFHPPIRVDETRVQQCAAQLAADAKRPLTDD